MVYKLIYLTFKPVHKKQNKRCTSFPWLMTFTDKFFTNFTLMFIDYAGFALKEVCAQFPIYVLYVSFNVLYMRVLMCVHFPSVEMVQWRPRVNVSAYDCAASSLMWRWSTTLWSYSMRTYTGWVTQSFTPILSFTASSFSFTSSISHPLHLFLFAFSAMPLAQTAPIWNIGLNGNAVALLHCFLY